MVSTHILGSGGTLHRTSLPRTPLAGSLHRRSTNPAGRRALFTSVLLFLATAVVAESIALLRSNHAAVNDAAANHVAANHVAADHAPQAATAPAATVPATVPATISAIPVPSIHPPAPTPAPRLHPHPTASALARVRTGMASWYGKVWQGNRTASGRRFDMAEMTAAHRSLPFGSHVRVTDLRNHKSVIVTITDRGAMAAGRVIDLSYAAADALGMVQSGLAPVSLEVLTAR